MTIWLTVECERCTGPGSAVDDQLEAWPELPQTTAAAVEAWILEHGCPMCGALDGVDVAVDEVDDLEDDDL